MERLRMSSKDCVQYNIDRILELFPQVGKEIVVGYDSNGNSIKKVGVDIDMLKQELQTEVIPTTEERYQFTWPEKRKAIVNANAPINATLRPVRIESVNFDDTRNLYIEGDNLDVLKLLQETYLAQIKMIYIDPPYNTGNDSFVYDDDFSMTSYGFADTSKVYDKNGNLLFDIRNNNESNGRFHTDWLNMMYPRLKLARNLLRDDGVIFISIDDNEVHNLRKICDEIFGESNFVGCAGRISKKANNQGDYWAPNFDYILTYAKNINMCPSFFGGINYKSYNQIEDKGPRKGERYQLVRLYMTSLDPMRGCNNQRYYIECPDGSFIIPPGDVFPDQVKDGAHVAPASGRDKVWRWSYQSYLEKKDSIVVKKGKSSNVVGENGKETLWNAYTKTYLNDVIDKCTATPNSFIEDHINQKASHELKKLDIPFTFAKPSSLIEYLAEVCQVGDDDIILDFFSGSATTGDAVMQRNLDGIRAKYILIQLPELCDEKSDAYKAGYKNICEIGKERLRRAGKIYLQTNSNIDVGFRVLKIDTSNMKDVYYNPSETQQSLFDTYADNIKEDRTPEDLLFQVMLDLGVLLSSKIEKTTIAGKQVFNVADGFLIACFDNDVTEETVKAVAEKKPYYAVFRDSSMANDSVATNFDQIFASISPDTVRKVL
ncbi:MAG: site-specific DNA-methyltransferase [Pseudobutyrivibrio sp.]|nr:site-specific DNA-methyltransferase [Pseudobutyrivibrio sp.]